MTFPSEQATEVGNPTTVGVDLSWHTLAWVTVAVSTTGPPVEGKDAGFASKEETVDLGLAAVAVDADPSTASATTKRGRSMPRRVR